MLTPLKTDGFNPLYASPLLPLSLCVEQEEARRQIEEHISDLQVEIDRPKTEQQDKRQELQRKVSGLPFTEVPHTYTQTHMNTHTIHMTLLTREVRVFNYIQVVMCTFGFASAFL